MNPPRTAAVATFHTIPAMRVFLLIGIITLPLFAADGTPPPARKVTITGEARPPADIAKAIREQTGTDVDVAALDPKPIAADLQKLDYWTTVERLAERTASRVVMTGGRVALKPGKSQAPSFVSGPFRFVYRDVFIRGDGESGMAGYTIHIDVAWEPWLNTYRIDTTPKITEAKDNSGSSVKVPAGGSRSFTTSNFAELTVRPQGLTRDSKRLSISGSILVTISDKLLTFSFDAVNGKPVGNAVQDGVSVNLTKHGPDGNDFVAIVGLNYPKSDVVWESHEYAWHRNNVMRLLPPKGEPIVADLVEAADLRYGFKGRAKEVGPGWKLDYRTPGPMREIEVKFELKDIKLP
jgi:hypothetical protein